MQLLTHKSAQFREGISTFSKILNSGSPSRVHILFAVSREPVGERTSDGGLVGSEGGYRIRRGCYFLPLGL